MTVQAHEKIVLNGIQTSMASCPSLPAMHSRVVSRAGDHPLSSLCWRQYVGAWEIKGQRLYLVGISGRFQLIGDAPLLADWVSGVLKISIAEAVRCGYGDQAAVVGNEVHIGIVSGHVIEFNAGELTAEVERATLVRTDLLANESVDFGVVKRYLPEKGFGFVGSTLAGSDKQEVFFHIKTLKKTHPDIARKLNAEQADEPVSFWYASEKTDRGMSVSAVLKVEDIRQRHDAFSFLTQRVEGAWKEMTAVVPDWLERVTLELLGPDRVKEFKIERVRRSQQQRHEHEVARQAVLQQQEDERLKREYGLETERIRKQVEESEFEQLVADVSALGFTHTGQLSNYIMKNKLGYKYKNISGVLKMMRGGDTWDFEGGFPPAVYAQICKALGLDNKGTRARAIGFTSFDELTRK